MLFRSTREETFDDGVCAPPFCAAIFFAATALASRSCRRSFDAGFADELRDGARRSLLVLAIAIGDEAQHTILDLRRNGRYYRGRF